MQVFYDLRVVAASRGDDAPRRQTAYPLRAMGTGGEGATSDGTRRLACRSRSALQDLPPACERLFDRLRRWFDVDDSMTVDLSTIAGAQIGRYDPYLIAGFTMRRLQAACRLAQPGARG